MRIGQGFDVHQLIEGRKLILGGVEVPYAKGLLGHSDADVLSHAIMDALLGAAALGDIGQYFPDDDPAYSNADSLELLARVWDLIQDHDLTLGNLDATLIAESPKLMPYLPQMRAKIAQALEADQDQISLKATTTEKLGFTGRGEGIAAQAVVLLKKAP